MRKNPFSCKKLSHFESLVVILYKHSYSWLSIRDTLFVSCMLQVMGAYHVLKGIGPHHKINAYDGTPSTIIFNRSPLWRNVRFAPSGDITFCMPKPTKIKLCLEICSFVGM